MIATEQLKAEHKGIKLMLAILEAICKKLEADNEIDSSHLEQILEFIKVFVDKCHHAKEEELLFPEAIEAGISKEGGPIGIMLIEHALGRDYVKGMGEAIAKYKTEGRKASPKLIENARSYIALLTQHIDKEDNILYPMADMRIPEAEHKELAEAFEKIEVERMGAGTHERFHELLHRLKDIYLE